MNITENYRIDANFRHFRNAVKDNEELYLVECGTERCRPDKSFGPITRDEYHVHIILDGKGTLEMGGSSYSLRRGQIFTLIPGIEHYYCADSENPWHYAWFTFAGTRAAYFMEKAGTTVNHPVRDTYAEPEQFSSIIEKMLNHHQLTVVNELRRTSLLYEAVSLLVDSWNQKAESSRQKPSYDYSSDVYVNSAVEYIRGHYSAIRVNDIAAYLGISRYYLAHIFKEKLHISPQEYLLNYRMEQSAILLRTTDLSIQKISEKAGYDNPLTFSKIFKNAYGLSPKNYRAKILVESGSD